MTSHNKQAIKVLVYSYYIMIVKDVLELFIQIVDWRPSLMSVFKPMYFLDWNLVFANKVNWNYKLVNQ